MPDAFSDPQYKTADGAALRIWRDAAPNRFLTEREGRNMYDEVLFCEVITPGSRDSTPVFELERVFCEEMNHPTPKRGPKYAEYKQFIDDFEKNEDNDASLAGTPLSQWPEMNRSLVATLKAQGVFTVDALAGLPDTKLTIVGPDGRSWREKAKAYIDGAKGGAYATELAGRVVSLETTLAASQEREKELSQRVQELETAAASGAAAPAAKIAAVEPAAPSVVEAQPVVAAEAAPVAVAAEGETLVPASKPKKAAADTSAMPII